MVPLSKVVQICSTQKELYEILQRNGLILPKITSVIINKDYLRRVFQKSVWVPHQEVVKIRNCPHPPTMNLLVEKLLVLAARSNLDTGIIMQKRNFPNVEWALIAIATLNPNEDIFARDYVPPAINKKGPLVGEVVIPDDPMFEGMESIFAGRKRGKKGMTSALLSRDEMLQMKIAAKQQRIQQQVEAARKLEADLRTLQQRAPNDMLGARESAHLR
jgi:hypothetical protein